MTVSGTWNCVVDSPMGKQKSVLTLVEEGGAVTGDNAGPMGTTPIVEGSAQGDAVTFKTEMTVPFPMTLTWAVMITGDTLSGEVEAGPFGKSPLTGTRG